MNGNVVHVAYKLCFYYYIILQLHNKAYGESKALPEIWIGSRPFCGGQPSECSLFGFDYIRSSESKCWTGRRVLCRARVPPPLSEPSPANRLKVISYNVFNLPYSIRQIGQSERTCRIPHKIAELHPDVDVIAFQEVFRGGCFRSVSMRWLLKLTGFTYHTPTAPRGTFKLTNGGVFIASRWPILRHKSIKFRKSSYGDWFASKGVMYAEINKTVDNQTVEYHVFNTHLQSGRNRLVRRVRLHQAGEINRFISSSALSIRRDEPVIIAGDLNVDFHEGNQSTTHARKVLEKTLRARIPAISGTSNVTYNMLDKHSSFRGTWLDYALYHRDYKQPTGSRMRSLEEEFRAESPFYACYWHTLGSVLPAYIWPEWCTKKRWIKHYSDHYPVLGTFVF